MIYSSEQGLCGHVVGAKENVLGDCPCKIKFLLLTSSSASEDSQTASSAAEGVSICAFVSLVSDCSLCSVGAVSV